MYFRGIVPSEGGARMGRRSGRALEPCGAIGKAKGCPARADRRNRVAPRADARAEPVASAGLRAGEFHAEGLGGRRCHPCSLNRHGRPEYPRPHPDPGSTVVR